MSERLPHDLQIIDELGRELATEQFDGAWDLVSRLESALERDPRYCGHERELMRQIKDRVSDMYAAKNKGLHPHSSWVGPALNGLRSSIRKRTTGPDGWPLA